MKKLIVTCTAVACAIAFIGCGGADTETPPEEETHGEELGADEDLKDLDPGGDDE